MPCKLEPEQKREVTERGSAALKQEFGVYFEGGRRVTWWDVVNGHRPEFARFAWRDVAALLHEGTRLNGLRPDVPPTERRYGDAVDLVSLTQGLSRVADAGFGERLARALPRVNTRHVDFAEPLIFRRLLRALEDAKPRRAWTSEDERLRAWAETAPRLLVRLLAEAGPTLLEVHERYGAPAERLTAVLLEAAREAELSQPDPVPVEDVRMWICAPSSAALLARLEEDVTVTLTRAETQGVARFYTQGRGRPQGGPEPLAHGLAKDLQGSSAVVRREVGSALVGAIMRRVDSAARGGAVTLADLEQRVGPELVDLVRSARGLASTSLRSWESRAATWTSGGQDKAPSEERLGALLRAPHVDDALESPDRALPVARCAAHLVAYRRRRSAAPPQPPTRRRRQRRFARRSDHHDLRRAGGRWRSRRSVAWVLARAWGSGGAPTRAVAAGANRGLRAHRRRGRAGHARGDHQGLWGTWWAAARPPRRVGAP